MVILCQDRWRVFTNGHRLSGAQLESDFLSSHICMMMMTMQKTTAFARRNYQQPESYKSSLQKHQAYHGHTGKAMIGPGFDKSIADYAMQRHKTSKQLPRYLAQNLVIPEQSV